MGRLFALAGMAGLLAGWIARNGSWGWPKFIGLYALTCVGLLVLTSYSRLAKADEPKSAQSMALTVQWPSGWHAQHLQGASSDPRDQRDGFRERAVLGDATPPRAVMEFSCVDAGDVPAAPREALQPVLDGLVKGFKAKGFTVSVDGPVETHIGTRTASAATLTVRSGDNSMMQNVGVAPGEGCLFVATFAGVTTEYQAALAAYTAARASVRVVKR
jgi:hypothetical protein